MKKNILIIATIFILPMITYFFLSSNGTNAEQKTAVNNMPKIVKFSSPLCRDCKILGENLDKVYPNYKDKIALELVSVEKTDMKTKKMVKTYHVTLVPTLLYINSHGAVLKRTVGSLTVDQLEANMKALINGTLR